MSERTLQNFDAGEEWEKGHLDLFIMRGVMSTHIDDELGSLNTSLMNGQHPQNIEIKKFIGDFVRDTLGYTKDTSVFLPNGSTGNQVALELARNKIKPAAVLCTANSHISISNVAKRLSVPVVTIPTTNLAVDEKALASLVRKHAPCVVSLTAGLTQFGAVESVSEDVLNLCNELGCWVHIDAAWGGLNIGLLDDSFETKQQLIALTSSPLVHSISTDIRKYVGEATLNVLAVNSVDVAEFNPVDYYDSSDLTTQYATTDISSRSVVRTAETIRQIGRSELSKLAKHNVERARCLKDALAKRDIPFVYDEIESAIVAVRCLYEEHMDQVRARLLEQGLSVSRLVSEIGVGFRIVITSDMYYSDELIDRIADVISKAWKENE